MTVDEIEATDGSSFTERSALPTQRGPPEHPVAGAAPAVADSEVPAVLRGAEADPRRADEPAVQRQPVASPRPPAGKNWPSLEAVRPVPQKAALGSAAWASTTTANARSNASPSTCQRALRRTSHRASPVMTIASSPLVIIGADAPSAPSRCGKGAGSVVNKCGGGWSAGGRRAVAPPKGGVTGQLSQCHDLSLRRRSPTDPADRTGTIGVFDAAYGAGFQASERLAARRRVRAGRGRWGVRGAPADRRGPPPPRRLRRRHPTHRGAPAPTAR